MPRIADYQKFLYQQKKKQKEIKAKQTKIVIKEIRFGPQTDDHDYNFKLKHAENFLKEELRSRLTSSSAVVRSSSRSRARFCCCALPPTEEFAKVELMPKLDGKKMNMILAPKAKK